MRFELFHALDADVMLAARKAARHADSRFVIGWWNDGIEHRLMLLPEGHHVTEERPFHALVRVAPSGQAELLAG
ncbi:MAG TPA: hypothetical protein VN802_20740 [Stellaceae bacterium]|nr:hypothetical protein [Stellaceae bacterium]